MNNVIQRCTLELEALREHENGSQAIRWHRNEEARQLG
jgi:hypothetical protein